MTLVLCEAALSPARHGVSLLHGWLPPTAWAVAAIVLVLAIGWRTRTWRLVWLPMSVVVGLVLVGWTHWFIDAQGLAGDPTPDSQWIWIGLTGFAVAVAILGWRHNRWWRRGVSLLAIPMCLLGLAVAVNLRVGYFPTVPAAWNKLVAGPLPDQTDLDTVRAMRGKGAPAHGALVPVDIPSHASGFTHRTELVYLPPAWFAAHALTLPVVMMIAGEFNTPSDWPRSGNAISTIDNFAAAHGGNAPVFVFVDAGGSFNNDTECVDGTRGNVADHLTKDVPPFVANTFGTAPTNWGVVGWSMGGTCAVDLTVMHPQLFSTFVDIAGDAGPNAGTKAQTIARLYRGDASRWDVYDPATVIHKHGPYRGVAGWFAISSEVLRHHNADAVGRADNADAVGRGGQDHAGISGGQTEAANRLCALGRTHGIDCAVVASPGRHDWPFAEAVFVKSLPWLAGQVGTPGVAKVPLPAGPDNPPPGQPVQATHN